MKTKYWIIIVLVLILMNISSLVLHWKGRLDSARFPQRPSPEKYMRERVGFSPQQHEQLKAIRNDHFMKMRPLEARQKDLRYRLFVDGTDIEKKVDIDSILNEIGNTQEEMDSLTYMHFQNVRSICTPEQAAEFNQIVDEMARRRFGQRHDRMERDHLRFKNR